MTELEWDDRYIHALIRSLISFVLVRHSFRVGFDVSWKNSCPSRYQNFLNSLM
jgi:hypothetical protein